MDAPSRRLLSTLLCIGSLALLQTSSYANHGPGASGGGSATLSGETLKQGHFELSLREDVTSFETFSTAQAIRKAQAAGDFDALDHSFVTTAELSYGLTDDLQISAAIGYFVGRDFVSADASSAGAVEVSHADPSGLTDLVLMAKYRVISGQPGNIAVVAGVVVPVGEDDVRLSNGEPLAPTDQPSSGRWGLPIGIAYSRFLTPKITVDASALYTFRFEKDDFKVGDRFDAGVALAYRFTESIKSFPQFSAFVELNDVYLARDQEHGQDDPNTGSNTLYVTPGVRVRFNPSAALTAAPSFPVVQEDYGDQGKVDFKFALTFALSF